MLFPAIMNGADMTDSEMVSVTSDDHSESVSPVGPSRESKGKVNQVERCSH